MKSNLHTLLTPISPEPGLEKRIEHAWEKKDKNHERYHFFLYLALALSGFVGTVSSIVWLVQDFTKSGFSSYLSVIFSERTQTLAYLKEFSLSLVESVPVISAAIFLLVFGVFLWSLVLLVEPVNNLYGTKKFV